MHYTYCFLCKGKSQFVQPGQDPMEHYTARGVIRLDDNNWYQPMMAVFHNGELVCHCPVDDWRNRWKLQEMFAQMPESERWQKACEYASECDFDDDFGLNSLDGGNILILDDVTLDDPEATLFFVDIHA